MRRRIYVYGGIFLVGYEVRGQGGCQSDKIHDLNGNVFYRMTWTCTIVGRATPSEGTVIVHFARIFNNNIRELGTILKAAIFARI